MKENEAVLASCPECGQNLFETYNSRCYGCGYHSFIKERPEEWINENDLWSEDELWHEDTWVYEEL